MGITAKVLGNELTPCSGQISVELCKNALKAHEAQAIRSTEECMQHITSAAMTCFVPYACTMICINKL